MSWDTDDQGRPTKGAVGEIVRDYGDQAVALIVEKFSLPWDWCESAVQAVLHPNGDSPTGTKSARTTRMSTVKAERVKWLWPGYLPLGKLVLLDGDPDQGKSTVTLDFAARVSTGSPWPDNSSCMAGNVLLLSAEDDKAATVRPRLDAAGADTERIHYLDAVVYHSADGEVEKFPTIPNDVDALRALVAELRPALVVVDVLMAYLDGTVDAYRDQHVRQALMPLAKLAEEYEFCAIIVRHFTKAAGGKAIHKGGGSVGFIGAARAAFVIAEDPDNPHVKVFACSKMNIARKPKPLEYRLDYSELHDCGSVVWLGDSSASADDLLNPMSDEQLGAVDKAANWLRKYLNEHGGESNSKDVRRDAAQAGHSYRTVQRARQDMTDVATDDTETWPRQTVWRIVPDPATVAPSSYVQTGATVAQQENPQVTQSRQTVAPNRVQGAGATVDDPWAAERAAMEEYQRADRDPPASGTDWLRSRTRNDPT